MSDTVTTHVLTAGPKYYIARFSNVSDGSGETLSQKVDISTLLTDKGLAPAKTAVKEIQWSIQGFTSVSLYWDHTTDALIDVLAPGNGYREYGELGCLIDKGTGETGDVLLSTAGADVGASYDITLVLMLIL